MGEKPSICLRPIPDVVTDKFDAREAAGLTDLPLGADGNAGETLRGELGR
ncbi:MAG: hypothetical protein OXE81_04555 [Gammaproteobacteria bacterium]|nr:hypothetical protein [Gammaproteobacteria bacterium]